MDKNDARRIIIHSLRSVSNRDYHLYHRLFKLPQWRRAHVVAVTLSTSIELDTQPIIDYARQIDKQIVVPKIFPRRRMKFMRDDVKTHLRRNRLGILEPVEGAVVPKQQIDLVIVPGLGFALKTHDRLGFGGGYYDRYLKRCRAYKVALARPSQLFQQPFWPVESNDVKMDVILY